MRDPSSGSSSSSSSSAPAPIADPFWFATGPVQRSAAPPEPGTQVRVTSAPEADPAAAFRDATSGGGGALPYRADMERSFGQDLGGVEAHVGRGDALRDTGMLAATRDEQVVFGDAQPTRELVAHEVAHVMQQRGPGAGRAAAGPVSGIHDDAEREADAVASRAAAGERVSVSATASAAIHPNRAKVIDAKHALVGQIFEVVGGSSSGQVYIRTAEGIQVTLEAGTYELLPDAAPSPAKKSKKRKETSAAVAVASTESAAASSGQAFGAGGGFGWDEAEYDDGGGVDALEASLVIVQADFMSGDRYGVAAALTLDARVGVILLTSAATRARAEEIKRFYDEVLARIGCDTPRVGICVVPDPHRAYVERARLDDATFEDLLGGAQQVSATFGTQLVADQLARWGVDGPDAVPAYLAQRWLGEPRGGKAKQKGGAGGAADPAQDDHVEREQALQQWLISKDMYPGRYAIIWTKTGSPDAEKAHHFTSPVAAKQLIDLAVKLGRIPILVGDDVGAARHLDGKGVCLGEFWNDRTFPFREEGRLGQLRLFRFLATVGGYDAVNIGMRSGALEGPALMGMQTIYLEEEGNPQARRMEKWLKVMPNYHRVILSSTPGSAQRRYLADLIADKIRRVTAAGPEVRQSEFFIDDVVPYTLRDEYLVFLRVKMEYLRFQAEMSQLVGGMEGFEADDLTNIADLLERSKDQLARMVESEDEPAFAGVSPNYAELFLKHKGAAVPVASAVASAGGAQAIASAGGAQAIASAGGSGFGSGSGSAADSGQRAKAPSIGERVLERLGAHHALMGALGGYEQMTRLVQTTEGPMLWDILEVFAGAEAQLASVLSKGGYMSVTQAHADLKAGRLKPGT